MSKPDLPVFKQAMSGAATRLNELLDSLSFMLPLCVDNLHTNGLQLALFGGRWARADLAPQTLTLTASATLYVFADPATGAAAFQTGTYPSGKVALGIATTTATGIASYVQEPRCTPALVP